VEVREYSLLRLDEGLTDLLDLTYCILFLLWWQPNCPVDRLRGSEEHMLSVVGIFLSSLLICSWR
jgi:hypothetical protein